jgi:uncharacterized protein
MEPTTSSQIQQELTRQGWETVDSLAEGGTALVFSARHPRTDKPVAIKVLKPALASRVIEVEVDNVRVRKSYRDLFQAEVMALSSVSHRNIMEILDAGEVILDDAFIPFFVMPFLEGAKDLYTHLEELDLNLTPEDVQEHFASLLRDTLAGLDHLHVHGLLHRDVKGENVIVDSAGHARITDLGGVKSADQVDGSTITIQDSGYLHPDLQARVRDQASTSDERRSFLVVPRIELHERGVSYDLFALGETIRKCIAQLKPRLNRDAQLFYSVLSSRLKQSAGSLALIYPDAIAVVSDLKKANRISGTGLLAPEMASPKHTLRLSPFLSVPITPGIKAILDTPLFRRLKSLKQLALVHLVYPGAQHTRFEHSIGVYHWTRRYLDALWHDPDDAYVREVADGRHIQALLLAALLHDIGQFPMAHAAEGVNALWFSHEKFGEILLDQSHPNHAKLPQVLRNQVTELQSVITEHFRGVELRDVLYILRNIAGDDPLRIDDNLRRIFHSILDGPIDADKADYTSRDVHHTGIGRNTFTLDPLFLQALTVNASRSEIALRPSGRDAAEMLIHLRYRLFKWVYWHRTVRSAEAILMAVFDELLRRQEHPGDWAWHYTVSTASMTENDALTFLLNEAKAMAMSETYLKALSGLQDRRLYRRILTIAPVRGSSSEEMTEALDLYTQLTRKKDLSVRSMPDDLNRAMDTFYQHLFEQLGYEFDRGEIVVDIPVPKRHDVKDFVIMDVNRQATSIRSLSHVWASIPEDFEDVARRIRVFVSPDFFPRVSRDLVMNALMKSA